MRRLASLSCCAVLFVVSACGGGDDGGGTPDAAAGTPDANGAAPVISKVAWAYEANCPTGKNVTITVTAADADTDAAMLKLTGSVSGCSALKNLDGTPAPLTGLAAITVCPFLAPYPATLTVTDPEGNTDKVASSDGLVIATDCMDKEITP